MVDKSLWTQKVEQQPEHSTWFVQRFRDMAAAGKDIAGEARFVDAMAPRGARILDAGCGSGRVGGPLAQRGHTVVGVDVDPVLIAAADEDYPEVTWIVGDLAELDPTSAALNPRFDVVVSAGNVMPFLAPSTRHEVLDRLRAVTAPGGRAAVGFGAGRGYAFADFFADLEATGWAVQSSFRGWNLLPFDADADFLVAVIAPTMPGRATRQSAAWKRPTGNDRRSGPGNDRRRRPGDSGADPMGGHTLRPMQ